MEAFATTDGVAEVARFFQETWRSQGWVVTVDGTSSEWVVSGFATRERVQHTAALQAHSRGTVGMMVALALDNPSLQYAEWMP